MAIFERTPPEASRRVLDSALPRFPTPSAATVRQLPEALPEVPSPTHPHPVYVLLLPDILAGLGLSAARLVAWRYLLRRGEGAVASAEVNTDEAETRHSFASMNEGKANQATLEAIVALENSPAIAAGNFELRLLRIPSLSTVAVWLHCVPGTEASVPIGADVLIPIPPANADFEQRRQYPQPEWESAMLDAAHAAEELARRTGLRPGPRPRY